MTGRQTKSINWFHESPQVTQNGGTLFIDLCTVDEQHAIIARKIIEELLKHNQLDILLQPNAATDQKLFQLWHTHQNTIAFDGHHKLGLGFPLIQLTNPKSKEHYLAPLFIWEVELEHLSSTQQWKLKREPAQRIEINFALQDYIKRHFKIDLLKLSHTELDHKKLNAISLSRVCYELSSALGKKEELFIDQIGTLSHQGEERIRSAAILGNFNNQRNIKPVDQQDSDDLPIAHHSFGLSVLDPNQKKGYDTFWEQAHSIVLANPGTGKSHLLHYLLLNGLSNGKTSLVLADSIERIRKIRNEFSAYGLDHLLFEIHDLQKDRQKLVQALRYVSPQPKEDFSDSDYDYLVNTCKRNQDRLDMMFQVFREGIFDKATWSQVLGNYLKYQRSEKKELLNNQLDPQYFTFHPTEYLSLKEAVVNSEPLFRKVNDLDHPLHLLHPDIFLENNKTEAARFVNDQLDLFTERFRTLLHRYITKQEDYAGDYIAQYERFYQESVTKIESLRDLMEDNSLRFGNEFEDSGLIKTGKLKVYGVFSNKHKSILQARTVLNNVYQSLVRHISVELESTIEFLDSIEKKSLPKIIQHLGAVEDQLHQWMDEKRSTMPEAMQRLNTKSVHPNLDYAEQISELEYTLDLQIEELNASGLYQLDLQNRMLTIPMRQLFIQDILKQLTSTKNHLPEFDAFYDWQRHWLLLPDVHRRLISAIIRVQPAHWLHAFQSWYFYQRLKQDYHFIMPSNDSKILEFDQNIQSLKEMLPVQIRQIWRSKNAKKISKADTELSMADLFSKYFELITKQFPVIVMSRHLAATLLNHLPSTFDLGIGFEDAIGEQYLIQQYSQRSMCFVPNFGQLIGRSNHHTVLNYVYKASGLGGYMFRNSLLEANQNRLAALLDQPSKNYRLIQCKGSFNNNKNITEAEALIEDVMQLKNDEVASPRIAIVCTTLEQRDFIQRKIQAMITSGSSSAEQLKKLCVSGLQVFHLSERFGKSFDRLYFSIGLNDFSPSSNELVTYLNSTRGYQQFTQLLSRTFNQTYIYHSFESADIDQLIAYKSKKTSRLIAIWLKFVQAAIKGDQKLIYDILDPDASTPQENHFLEEIANELQPFIGKQRILQYKEWNGMQFPLMIAPPDGQGNPSVVFVNGALDSADLTSPLWNLYFINYLKSKGLSVAYAWSVNWFENPALEARRLASLILKADKD